MVQEMRDITIISSGGGRNGYAWGLGCLQAMRDHGIDLERVKRWRGISAGSLLGAAFGSGGLKLCEHILETVRTKDVARERNWLGKLIAVIFKNDPPRGILDSSYLEKTVDDMLDMHNMRTCGCNVEVGFVALDELVYLVADQFDDEFPAALKASAANPFFNLVRWKGRVCADGGLMNITDIKNVLDETEDHDIYIFSAQAPTARAWDNGKRRGIEWLMRCVEASILEVGNTDFVEGLYRHPLVKAVCRTKEDLGDSVDFDLEPMEAIRWKAYDQMKSILEG